jgi:hypothetical protein
LESFEAQVQFEDALPEVLAGIELKGSWNPGGLGRVLVTETGLVLEGPSRFSGPERNLFGGILAASFLETVRHHKRNLEGSDIQRVVARTKPGSDTRDTIAKKNDIVHIFTVGADGTQEVHCFSLNSRRTLSLFWTYLTRLLPNEKLELQTTESSDKLAAPCTVSVTRLPSFAGALARHSLILNGTEVGTLKNGASLDVATEYGTNELLIRGTPPDRTIAFDAVPGGMVRIEYSARTDPKVVGQYSS